MVPACLGEAGWGPKIAARSQSRPAAQICELFLERVPFSLMGFWKGGHPITQSFQVSGLMVLRADAPLPIPVA